MSYFDDVNTFLDAADAHKATMLDIQSPDLGRLEFCISHVDEEWNSETKEALTRYLSNPSLENLVEVADGIGDTIYVLCQLARSLGIPLNSVWNCIQSANMEKVRNGKVIRNEVGKILKPAGWVSPNERIWNTLKEMQDIECVKQGKMGADSWSNTAEVMAKHQGE